MGLLLRSQRRLPRQNVHFMGMYFYILAPNRSEHGHPEHYLKAFVSFSHFIQQRGFGEEMIDLLVQYYLGDVAAKIGTGFDDFSHLRTPRRLSYPQTLHKVCSPIVRVPPLNSASSWSVTASRDSS